MCIKGPKRTNSDTITNINKNSIIKDNLKSQTQTEKKTVRVQQTPTGSFHNIESESSDLKVNPSTISIVNIFPRNDNMESSTNIPSKTNSACSTTNCANVVTIPVPIVHNEGTFYYITVKGSLHDRSCSVFGLNEAEIQAISKRFENGVKPVMNGVMIGVPPMDMVNTLSQLSYKVVCSSGEAEICWTMQREV